MQMIICLIIRDLCALVMAYKLLFVCTAPFQGTDFKKYGEEALPLPQKIPDSSSVPPLALAPIGAVRIRSRSTSLSSIQNPGSTCLHNSFIVLQKQSQYC